MTFVGRPGEVVATALSDPAELLAQARALEPVLRLTERTSLLARLQRRIDAGAICASDGRDWQAECWAERAVDAARVNDLATARDLAGRVLSSTSSPLALARATEAQGRLLAWTGTDAATRAADRVLIDAVQRYRMLGADEWAGHMTFWRANTVLLQQGQLDRAVVLMREALALLDPQLPWHATVLTFLADVFISRGAWADAEAALTRASELIDGDDVKTRAYLSWSRARMSSTRGDAQGTERHIRDTERQRGDWFDMDTGVTFLADAAEMLDRVGLPQQATTYLSRAVERCPDDEFVRQAGAALMARRGDPLAAVDTLQSLTRGDWLEKRVRWRHTLLAAWATFRAGRDDAGVLAIRAFEQAAAAGGIEVALYGEPDIASALLPLAEATGFAPARARLLVGRQLLVRLLGPVRVVDPDGAPILLPPGKPAELVRLLAVHPHGVAVEQVAAWFFPDTTLETARPRLRQILARLRATAGNIVKRDKSRLRLVPAWVDVREFLAAADQVRSASRAHQIQRAYAALALWGGTPLAADTYSPWARDLRGQLDHRHLTLLDLVAAHAGDHGSHHEATTAISAALVHAPHERGRYYTLAHHLTQLGRHNAAQHPGHLSGVDLDGHVKA